MSSHLWHITKHTIPAAHVRGYERGVRDEQTARLRLAINQYTPQSNPKPERGDVTLIMVHATGAAKERYEPLFDELLARLPRIRNIWSIDAAHQGASYLLNQNVLGDDLSWFDFSRDIWQMINHFQAEMPPPLVGMGESLGATHLVMLSTWHARLFSGLVFFEPAHGPREGYRWPRAPKYFPGVIAAKRKDTWPSREAARAALAKSPHYAAFDPRVFERVVQYEFCPAADVGMPDRSTEKPSQTVTLATPKAIEAYMWMRVTPPFTDRALGPLDDTPVSHGYSVEGFFRPEGPLLYQTMPFVYPPILIIWGQLSELFGSNTERGIAARKVYVGLYGTGVGGGGGAAAGQVSEKEVSGAHHTVSLERPNECAAFTAEWLSEKMHQWETAALKKRKEYVFDNTKVNPHFLEKIAKL